MDTISRNNISQTVIIKSEDVHKESSSEISDDSKNNPSYLGSSLQKDSEQLSSRNILVYEDAFENVVDDCEYVPKKMPHSSLSDQHRSDGEYVIGNKGARPKTYSYSHAVQSTSIGKTVSLAPCSNSRSHARISDPFKKLLSAIDMINVLNIGNKKTVYECHNVIKNIDVKNNYTQENKVLLIEKLNRLVPLFTSLNWTAKSMLHHKLRSLNMFYEITDGIRFLQVNLINSLMSVINAHCRKVKLTLINPIGLSSLMVDIRRTCNDSLLIEFRSKSNDMLIEILTVIASDEVIFFEDSSYGVISAIAHLVKTDKLSSRNQQVRGAVDFLLKCVANCRGALTYNILENILVDIKELIRMGVINGADNIGIDVAISLSPYLIKYLEQPKERDIALFLVIMSFITDKSVSEKRFNFKDVLRFLLCYIPAKSSSFNNNEIANILSSCSLLLNSNLIKPDERLFTEAVISLVPIVKKRIPDNDCINICTMISCIGKIISYNANLQSELVDLFEKLLVAALEKTDNMSVHHICIMMRGIGHLSSQKVFNKESTDNIHEIYLFSVSLVEKKARNIFISDISGLLWGYGQLIEHGVVCKTETLRGKSILISIIRTNLKILLDTKESLNIEIAMQVIKNMSKMIYYSISDFNMRQSVDEFFVKFITVLFGNESEIEAEEACKVISNIGKLIKHGAIWTKDVEEFTDKLLNSFIHKNIKVMSTPAGPDYYTTRVTATAEAAHLGGKLHQTLETSLKVYELEKDSGATSLIGQGIKKRAGVAEVSEKVQINTIVYMLDALALIGLRLKNLKYLLRKIIQGNILRLLESGRNQALMLSSLTYFYSWYDENTSLRNDLREMMIYLIAQVSKRSQKDEPDEYPAITMANAKFWLDIDIGNISINYDTSISSSQKDLLRHLRIKYSDYKIESEVSRKGLSPVDILFMEINGPQHYLDECNEILNGKHISKGKAYTNMGFTVLNVPTSEIKFKNKEFLLQLYNKIDTHIAKLKSTIKFKT
ncbi:MAG: hypothetical protein KAG53_00155 [Endozoicomonadaceae bacterium]|nr:hypothetical protein [Endozoicomonadaceae bacterium]